MSATLPPARLRVADRRRVPPGCPLSGAEYEVLTLVAEGLPRKEIARRRHCSYGTVSALAHLAYQRLGVSDAAQAMLKLGREGWLGWTPPPPPEPEDKLPPFLRAYLQAFDEHLRSGSRQSRRAMRIALLGQANETGREQLPRPCAEPLDGVIDGLVRGRARRQAKVPA